VNEKARRKELRDRYKEIGPQAGVYRIVNCETNRALLGSTLNLASIRNKLEFSKSTRTSGALDRRLRNDIELFGIDAFAVEVLDVLETRPEMTPAEIKDELAVLEQLWREKLDPDLLY
jgi:hypothetical protein